MTAGTQDLVALAELAEQAGVLTDYHDWLGQHRQASPEVLLAVLRMLGAELDGVGDAPAALHAAREARWRQLLEPCVVAWDDEPARLPLRLPADAAGSAIVELEGEGGQRRRVEVPLEHLPVVEIGDAGGQPQALRHLPVEVPGHGYHRATVTAGGRRGECLVIAAPRQAYAAPGAGPRAWGAFAPLYALHGEGGLGAGSIGELRRLAGWVAGLGGSFVGTLPLLSGFMDEPFEPSPYSPVSRLFWNEFYLDLAAAPGLDGCEPARARLASAELGAAAAKLRAEPLVDYRAQMAHVRSVLEPLAASAWQRPALREALDAYLAARPRAADYARFRAAVERTGQPWTSWSAPQRDGQLDERDYDEAAWRYHVYVQYAMNEQLAALDAGGAGLYLDLPVGVNCHGYDAWRERDSFAMAAAAGAPPDELFRGGQNWGLPPLHPERSRRLGHRYFIECVRNHMEHACLLRVDHVMGLHRLYWIPDGVAATEGVYVRYRAEELYAIVCLESHRRRCAVVGEDLGTVPDDVRPAMARHGMHRLFVAQFAMPWHQGQQPGQAPADAVASLNTHDTPTFAGFWQGAEIEQRVEMGLLSPEQAEGERAGRAGMREATAAFARARRGEGQGDGRDPDLDEVASALTDHLAAGPAQMLLVNLEDLWLEPEPQNVPGTSTERPNWRRKMRLSLEEILADAAIDRRLRRVDALRRGPPE